MSARPARWLFRAPCKPAAVDSSSPNSRTASQRLRGRRHRLTFGFPKLALVFRKIATDQRQIELAQNRGVRLALEQETKARLEQLRCLVRRVAKSLEISRCDAHAVFCLRRTLDRDQPDVVAHWPDVNLHKPTA